PHADASDLETGDGVEQRGFARPGRAGESHDREVLPQTQSVLCSFEQFLSIGANIPAQFVGAQRQRVPNALGQAPDLRLCRTVHNATSSRSPDERRAPDCRAGTADSLNALSNGVRQPPTIPAAAVRKRCRNEPLSWAAAGSPKCVSARLSATPAPGRAAASASLAYLGSQKVAYAMTAQTPETPKERIRALDFLPCPMSRT